VLSTIHEAVLEAAAAKTETEIARAIVSCLGSSRVVLARLWLLVPSGDLKLTASSGTPAGGGAYTDIDGSFAVVQTGVGKIGRIASSREATIVTSVRGDEEWITNPGWIARQGVRAFFGFPLVNADDVLGVLAVFERSTPAEDRAAELQFLADYAATRLADVRERRAQRQSPTAPGDPNREATDTSPLARPTIFTRHELRALERETIATALEQSAGRVFGPHGAARLLGMKPTTLASRIKVLGLRVR
jgi:transcriptional regulator with GAF, ATPase, and Fis domain